MIVIADNDVLKKLACCDLYVEFSQAFEVSFQEIFILNTAKPVLTSKKHRARIDEESFQRLTDFLDAVKVITMAPDPDEQAALTEQQNIDAGEAVLFSVTNATKNSILATGDKRSLVSLAKTNDAICKRLCEKLAGKVVCFEQIIWKILNGKGFDTVRDKLIVGRECDKVLALILGSGLDASEESVREGLITICENRRAASSLMFEQDWPSIGADWQPPPCSLNDCHIRKSTAASDTSETEEGVHHRRTALPKATAARKAHIGQTAQSVCPQNTAADSIPDR